jgi:methionyl aminopeptidase
MSITSEVEWNGLRAAGEVVRLTLDALERAAQPGVTTGELDRLAARIFSEHGARSAPALVYRFPGTVLISVNDEVVHGIPGSRRLRRGDVVKLDVTVERDGYMADAARTVVLPGAAARAYALRDCAEAAFLKGLEVAQPGRLVREVSRAIEREVRRCGFAVVPDLSGHGIGRTIHEPPTVPNVYTAAQKDVLTDGLVVAIEPIICDGSGRVVTARDGWTIRTRDGSAAAHYENTVVITAAGPQLLTAA